METYIIDINECIVGLIASPLSVHENVHLMADTTLQLMTKMGFSSIAEYQNNLPGHSDKDLGGFDEPYDRTLRYNLLGSYNDNHPIGIALYRNPVAYDDLFKDLRTIFFDARKYDNCCAFILQPTVEDMKQVVHCLNYKTDEYFKYCSDWEDNTIRKLHRHHKYKTFFRNIFPATCTKSGYFAIAFTIFQLYSVLKGHFDSIALNGVVIFFTLMLWCNVIEMAYKGKADPKEEPLFSFKHP